MGLSKKGLRQTRNKKKNFAYMYSVLVITVQAERRNALFKRRMTLLSCCTVQEHYNLPVQRHAIKTFFFSRATRQVQRDTLTGRRPRFDSRFVDALAVGLNNDNCQNLWKACAGKKALPVKRLLPIACFGWFRVLRCSGTACTSLLGLPLAQRHVDGWLFVVRLA